MEVLSVFFVEEAQIIEVGFWSYFTNGSQKIGGLRLILNGLDGNFRIMSRNLWYTRVNQVLLNSLKK